jgi:hypothetical protein
MKIPTALEEMVAGLISDERKERERVEGILSQIHELTAAYFKPGAFDKALEKNWAAGKTADLEDPPAPVLSQAEKLKNFTSAFERRGMPPERAQDAAEEALGMRDGSR